MATEFPRDVLFDILLRLDARSLCRFRCVSKPWNNLIYDPYFVQSHMQQSMKKPYILFNAMGMKFSDRIRSLGPFDDDNSGRTIRQHHDPFLSESVGFQILSSCRGLILFSIGSPKHTWLYLMNPVSLKKHELPSISESYSNIKYGLGYSNSTKEFKVVRFFSAKPGCGCEFFLLSDVVHMSNSLAWTRIYDDNIRYSESHGTLAGGSLFWNTSVDGLILEFIVESNKVSLVNNPPGWLYSLHDFVEIKGELGISNRSNIHVQNVLEIWILKDKENSLWVRTYNINIRTIRLGYTRYPIYFVGEDTWFVECSLGRGMYMCNRNADNVQELATLYNWCSFYRENLSIL